MYLLFSEFFKDPIHAEKIGLITQRSFSHYDLFKEPNLKYFAEILENSLPESDRLLEFN